MPALPTNPIVKPQPLDGVVAGKPVAGSVLADQPFTLVRLFKGSGPPAAGTLSAANVNVLICNGKYLVDDLYQDTTARVLYVCTAPGTNATSDWVKISGGGGTSYFRFKSDGGDIYNCVAWNGSVEGAATQVAKRHKLRTSLATETIDGDVFNYTYSGDGTTRYTTGAKTQTDVVTPPYLANDIVVAASMTTDIFGVVWQAIDERAWGMQNTE